MAGSGQVDLFDNVCVPQYVSRRFSLSQQRGTANIEAGARRRVREGDESGNVPDYRTLSSVEISNGGVAGIAARRRDGQR